MLDVDYHKKYGEILEEAGELLGTKGTDHNATSYKVECLIAGCGHMYGANGTDVFHRKCPRCQGGLLPKH